MTDEPKDRREVCAACGQLRETAWENSGKFLCAECLHDDNVKVSCDGCAAPSVPWCTYNGKFLCDKCEGHLYHERFESRCEFCVVEREKARRAADEILLKTGAGAK